VRRRRRERGGGSPSRHRLCGQRVQPQRARAAAERARVAHAAPVGPHGVALGVQLHPQPPTVSEGSEAQETYPIVIGERGGDTHDTLGQSREQALQPSFTPRRSGWRDESATHMATELCACARGQGVNPNPRFACRWLSTQPLDAPAPPPPPRRAPAVGRRRSLSLQVTAVRGGRGGSATVLSSSERTVRAPGLQETFAKLSMPQTAQEVPHPPLFPTTSPRLLFASPHSRPRRTCSAAAATAAPRASWWKTASARFRWLRCVAAG
jgi:hypothetical protein